MNKKDILSYIIIIVVVILIKSFIVTPVRVNGTSMEPTLKNKEIMILNKISLRFNDIKRFDIVVIDVGDDYYIKRVIGLPGEIIMYKDNTLYIDGKEVIENYLKEETNDFVEYKIPNDCYYVMGDNRNDSLDSRYLGCFKKNKILGKANLVLFPFKDFGYKY